MSVRARVLVIALAALAALVLPHGVRAQGVEPPLQISADRMSGSHGPDGDIVDLAGNVRIVRAGTVITSETGTYHREIGTLYLKGRVKIVDSTTTILCDEATYTERTDVVRLAGHVRATGRKATLESPSAIYDRRLGRADMFDGVEATYGEHQRMHSDSASYFRDSTMIHARGHVRGLDEQNKVTLTAREVDYDRDTQEAQARGEPMLEEQGDHDKVTRITSRLLRVNTDTRVAEAIDSVHVQRDTLQARGDYGLFDDEQQRGWLLGKPRAWNDETNVTGDTLEFRSRARVLERVIVRGNAVMDYRGVHTGARGETSRLTGDRVDVFFTNQDIDSLISIGRAQNEYTALPAKGKTAETNLAEGDTIRVFMKDGKIDEARVLGRARGEYHLGVAVGDTASADREIVSYEALAIRYILPKNQIVLDQDAHLTYGDLDLKAHKVEFNSEEQTLVAEGEPELVDRGDKVTGHLMTYDLESRVGNIYQAETSYEKGLYHGEHIRKVSDNELDIAGGSFSTCDRPDPHFHFQARWMKIYIKDKLVAKPVVLYIQHVPLLALPFWIFPIRPGRHSGFLFPRFELGFSNAAGRFVRNLGYYWAPNDYFDITASGDYYDAEPSWVLRTEGVYKLLYAFDGEFSGSFAKNEAAKTEDWDLDADHAQELGPHTRLTARASYVSSKDYNSSNLYGRTIAQRFNRFLVSNLAFTHQASWASYNVVLDRRQDLDADQSVVDPDALGPAHGPPPGTIATLPSLTQNLPSISVSLPTRAIGSYSLLKRGPLGKYLQTLYASVSGQFQSFHEERAIVTGLQPFELVTSEGDTLRDTTTVVGHTITERQGADATAALTDSRRMFGWINVQPSLVGNAAVFDHDEQGNRIVPTGTWSASVASSATLYGTTLRKIGPITGMRHVLAPRVSFSYSPEFPNLFFVDSAGVKRQRFKNFGNIGVSGFKSARLDFGLDQRLQLRLGSGEKTRKLDNFALLSIGSSYNFLYKEQGQPHPLTPFGASLLLQPPNVFNVSSLAVIDPYQGRPLRSLTYNVGASFQSRGRTKANPDLAIGERRTVTYDDIEELQDAWNLGLAYSYAGGYSGPLWSNSQTLNVVWRMRVTPSWNLNYSAAYDVTHQDIGVQQYSISRDLHCWTMSFTRTFAPGGEAEYYFRIGVKDQRELFIDRGTRSGSVGGLN